jgi:hypothetical protein
MDARQNRLSAVPVLKSCCRNDFVALPVDVYHVVVAVFVEASLLRKQFGPSLVPRRNVSVAPVVERLAHSEHRAGRCNLQTAIHCRDDPFKEFTRIYEKDWRCRCNTPWTTPTQLNGGALNGEGHFLAPLPLCVDYRFERPKAGRAKEMLLHKSDGAGNSIE